jgi:hypothetical protein
MSETAWVKIYRVFLLLFPPSFRAEFSEEMLEVFFSRGLRLIQR